MTLTTDRMATLTRLIVLDAAVGDLTPEEHAFVDAVQKDVAWAAKEGYVVDIPGEWPQAVASREPSSTTGGKPDGGKPART